MHNGNALAAIDDAGTDTTLEDKSLAIQKSVAVVGGGPAVPGAVLEYTLSFQVSDFFSFDELVLADDFSDGQRFDATFAPTFSVTENGLATNGGFAGANFDIMLNSPGDGRTAIQLRLSDELIAQNADGTLDGDLFADAIQVGGTVGTVTYRTVIQEDFSDTFASGDNSVDMGDTLDNNVQITGDLPNDNKVTDDSAASITIAEPSATKSIFAVDGDTGFTELAIAPGQTIAYRLRFSLPTGDVEDLLIEDFLPLPVFAATEVSGPIQAFSGPPAAGVVSFGPAHTLPGTGLFRDDGTPFDPQTDVVISTDAVGNTVSFDFGSFDDPGAGGPYEIDLLFTVSATDEPFADGLFLTNQGQFTTEDTDLEVASSTEIVQIELIQPNLALTKGVVSSDASAPVFDAGLGPAGVSFAQPGGAGAPFSGAVTSAGLETTPIDANIADIDAGDLVKFAITVENTGQRDAFDVLVRDLLTAGFEVPVGGQGLNLQGFSGDGTALSFTSAAGGAIGAGDEGSFSFSNVTGAGDNAGIRIVDPTDGGGSGGALGAGVVDTTNNILNATGSNVAIITYDLTAAGTVVAGETHTNTAELLEFAAVNGGADFTDGVEGQFTDDATSEILGPALAKNLIGSAIDNLANASNEAVIGELITYELVLTLPEGVTENVQITDTLDAGLAFVVLTSVSRSSADLTTTQGVGDFSDADPGAVFQSAVGAQGATVTFDLGDLSNANTDNPVVETVTLTYTAVVLNVATNQDATALNNNASLTANNGISETAAAANVLLLEPALEVLKLVSVDGGGSSGDAGDTVVYTVTVQHTGANQPDAFEVSLSDVIPGEILGAGITGVSDSLGILGLADFEIAGGVLQVAVIDEGGCIGHVAIEAAPIDAGRVVDRFPGDHRKVQGAGDLDVDNPVRREHGKPAAARLAPGRCDVH